MTVLNTTRSITYAGDGADLTFSYPFKVTLVAQLVVTLILDSTGVETVQTLTTHYTVTGVGLAAGGVVTFITAPPTGNTVKIERVVDLTQLLDLLNQGTYKPQNQEDSLDLIVMMIQQVNAASKTFKLTEYTAATRPPASLAFKNTLIALRNATGPTKLQGCVESATAGNFEWKDFREGDPW